MSYYVQYCERRGGIILPSLNNDTHTSTTFKKSNIFLKRAACNVFHRPVRIQQFRVKSCKIERHYYDYNFIFQPSTHSFISTDSEVTAEFPLYFNSTLLCARCIYQPDICHCRHKNNFPHSALFIFAHFEFTEQIICMETILFLIMSFFSLYFWSSVLQQQLFLLLASHSRHSEHAPTLPPSPRFSVSLSLFSPFSPPSLSLSPPSSCYNNSLLSLSFSPSSQLSYLLFY